MRIKSLDTMKEIARDLDLHQDKVFCGYLRQPIFFDDGVIVGECILKGRTCKYKVPMDVEECGLYKHQLKEPMERLNYEINEEKILCIN